MKRVIAVLALFCFSCVDRTENLDFSTTTSVELEIPEMIVINGLNEGKAVKNGSENGVSIQQKNNNNTDIVTNRDEVLSYSDTQASVFARNDANKDAVSEAVFYIFDEKGLFVSKNAFIGSEDYKLEFRKNGLHSVYVLCNISEFIDLPDTPTQNELESLTIPHRGSYDRFPFAGKTQVEVVPGEKPAIRIKLARINSAIRIENRSIDRMTLTSVTVNGLPDRGTIFGTDTEAAEVTYSESAEAEIDADGNAVVYSFFVPESKMPDVKIEVQATVKEDSGEATGKSAATIAPVTFAERLETGKQATAFVGYLESGNIKIGSPDNWGNVGSYELSDGTRLQVIGGEFFAYKSVKALRAYSGGSEFSCIVSANDGAATLSAVGTTEWITVRDNIIIVAPNDTDTERECQISVTVGGNKVGVFYIVQSKAIRFSCASATIENDRLIKIGGTGSSSAITSIAFDISDAELDNMEILPENNGTGGVTVTVDRSAKTVNVSFMALVNASLISAEGVSVPVKFVDINGRVNATLTVVQRPAKITFNPAKHPNVSYRGATVMAAVTTEKEVPWKVRTVTDGSGAALDGSDWFKVTTPTGNGNSGSNMICDVAANNTSSGRTALVYVQASFTVSKPYEIIQSPSYGLKDIRSDIGWDATSSTLQAYSKGRTYNFTFATETAVPDGITLAIDTDVSGNSGIKAGTVVKEADNNYSFTLTVPDSDDPDEEVVNQINITADGAAIGGFTVKRAYKPTFIDINEEIWGGVKDRPYLKTVTYRASEWDLRDFSSSNDDIEVTMEDDGTLTVGYAETLLYSDAARSTTVAMNLSGGNTVSYTTTQAPVTFTISTDDLAKLKNVTKEATDIGITVTTQGGTAGTPWHVASTSAGWLTTSPAAGDPETNASGTTLTVKFAANTVGDRTGTFVLESRNTTSPTYDVSQNGAFSATIGSVIYNTNKQAVFADGMLKAFSAAYDYTFNIATNNAVTGNKLSVVSRTSGTAVTIKTQPSGTSLSTSHSFVITVPASASTTEPESEFDIMADGNRIGGFTVKQAKKPSISVGTTTTLGGTSTPVAGTFTASVWELAASNYVTSSNTTLSIASPNTAGTFSVNMKQSFLSTDANLSATITLVGVNGNLATCPIAQNKVVYTLTPTSLAFAYNETAGKTVTVASTNAGTTAFPDMTATSSATWCKVTVSGNTVTVKVTENSNNTPRTATVYVTYLNSSSQNVTVTQEAKGSVTIGGIQWAIYNLANPRQASGGATFATKLPSECTGTREASLGKLYQWSYNVAWNATGSSASGATPSGYWQSGYSSNRSWSPDPCPDGFRLPTENEYKNLINACEATYYNGGKNWGPSDYGYVTLTDKTNSNNKLEFPAVGYRNESGGTLGGNGKDGNYWASDQYSSTNAYYFNVYSNSLYTGNSSKRLGRSLRCVRQ